MEVHTYVAWKKKRIVNVSTYGIMLKASDGHRLFQYKLGKGKVKEGHSAGCSQLNPT